MKKLYFLIVLLIFSSCQLSNEDNSGDKKVTDTAKTVVDGSEGASLQDSTDVQLDIDTAAAFETTPSALGLYLQDAGLVDVQEVVPGILVDLKYSTEDNFLGIDMYGDLNTCYLQKDVAEKLKNAQRLLKETNSRYSLIVFDGVRPRSIQQLMWDTLDMPANEKPKYLSNPQYGSLHNFGAAIDLSIVDKDSNLLDMGTPYDFFGELAHPTLEKKMLAEGRLTHEQVDNRKLLRKVMHKAGFFNIQTEWWHFNSCYRKEARKKYTLIEYSDEDRQNYLTLSMKKREDTSPLTAEQEKDTLFARTETDPVSIEEPEPERPEPEVSWDEPAKSASVIYRVQIATSTNSLDKNNTRFKGEQVFEYSHEGAFKYTVGEFTDLSGAIEDQYRLRNAGFEGAFVVAFYQGERISLQEAKRLRGTDY